MRKRFNTTGPCYPEEHYMVNIQGRIEEIKLLVDQACNHEIFLTFLGMLRKKYLARRNQPAFQSLILAGVYDVMSPNRRFDDLRTHQRASDNIKNMKLKIRQDVNVGMDISEISKLIYDYTSGYPFCRGN